MEIVDGGRGLRVDTDAGAHTCAALWLRDVCHCPDCRRPVTNERLLDPTSIDPAITVRSARWTGAVLAVDLSDSHRALVHSSLLGRAVPGVGAASRRSLAATDEVKPPVVGRIAASDVPHRLLDVLDRLSVDGAVVLTGVRPDDDGLRGIASLIGPIHPTNYGTTWTIDAVVDPVSEVESDRALLVHTDLPYRTDPPGVQLLLACRIDVSGGHSTLVDGVDLAERLRATDPDAFHLLARVPVEYPYVRENVEIVGAAPLIELDHAGEVRVIRRAPDLMGAPQVRADEADRFYAALRRWWRVLDDPAATLTVPLEPGELLLFDNHRMLHGRTAFDLGASGRRILRGCYLHRDDVASRHAVLARREM